MLGVLVSDTPTDLQETAVVDGAFGEPVCAHEETPVCASASCSEGAEGAVLGRGESWLRASVFLPRSKSSRPRKPPATSSSIRAGLGSLSGSAVMRAGSGVFSRSSPTRRSQARPHSIHRHAPDFSTVTSVHDDGRPGKRRLRSLLPQIGRSRARVRAGHYLPAPTAAS